MKYKIGIIICLVLVAILLGCGKTETIKSENKTELANPASVYCEEQGGKLRIIEVDGGQSGVCTLADGTECEEWAYYRGECPKHICTEEEKQDTACTLDYNPVCGSDGKTYSNGCTACAAKADSWVKGECAAAQPEKPVKEMPAAIVELLNKHNKIKSFSYGYRGPDDPDSIYRFAVKGNKLRVVLPGSKYLQEDEYNAIYFDTELKTAQAYCDDSLLCKTTGKKKDMDYDKSYIETPIDWIKKVTYAEKTEEKIIENRPAWKLETNAGTMLVETFYGVPYEVKSEGKTHTFRDVVFNQVEDGDVTPP